jgi:hypothetical protein
MVGQSSTFPPSTLHRRQVMNERSRRMILEGSILNALDAGAVRIPDLQPPRAGRDLGSLESHRFALARKRRRAMCTQSFCFSRLGRIFATLSPHAFISASISSIVCAGCGVFMLH